MAKSSFILYQPPADIFTWLALNLGLSANAVSWFMVLCGVLGGIFLFMQTKPFAIAGMAMMLLAIIVDHADGMVAKIREQYSKRGAFLDQLWHMVQLSTTFLGIGYFTYTLTGDILYLHLGVFTTVGLFAVLYLRDLSLAILDINLYKDIDYRQFPRVLIYGDYFKEWSPLLTLAVIFNFTPYALMLSALWIVIRVIGMPILFYSDMAKIDAKKR